MSLSRKLEVCQAKAKRQEEKYDWLSAIDFYKKASCFALELEDLLRTGETGERIGYCFYRSAFQAETNEDFKKRMQSAVEAYNRAAEQFEKAKKRVRADYCKALAIWVNYWIAPSYAEKKELSAECRRLLKKVATAYKEAGYKFGYGKACNELLECVWHSLWFVPEDWGEAKEIYEDGIRFGESAISALSEARDEHELARAYFLTCRIYFWGHLIGRREFVKKMPTYAQRAVELSEKLKDAYLIAQSSWPAAWSQVVLANNLELGRKHCKEMLKQGKKTKDNSLIGEACFLQLWQTGWATAIEEDPDKLKEMFEEINAFAEEAIAHLSLISWEEMVALTYSFYAYAELATEVETDYNTKRILFEKAVEAGRKGLEHAERAGAVWPMTYSLSLLSKAQLLLSSIETNLETKNKLLKEALAFGEKSKLMLERLMPSNYIDRGAREDLLARIKTELAKVETDMKTKRELLEEAVSNMEERLKLFQLYKEHWTLRPEETRLQSGELGFYFGRLGGILAELYSATNDKKVLERIANVYESAFQAFSKAQLPSRVAEAHWHISKVYDQLGEYSESAQNFNLASKSYMFAAEKIPQLQDFYSEYASYMEAWTELEKSRFHHENENYAQSREHYRMCSHHLKSTKKWSYLASYYFAWSLLEHAEDLSKLDRPQDAIKAFAEAGIIFEDSMSILREKVEELYSSEERDEASKLATIARLRKKYCTGRVLMEKAKLCNRKGDKALSAKKHASAARIFEGIVPNLEREEARGELQFAASLCWAWEKMELAEERRDAALFRKASELFAKAREITRKRTAGLIAVGNSCFCKALELGTKFRVTSNIDFYARAKLQMENAADYYWKAGFEKAALWVKATKRLFDAFIYAGKAEAEADPEKRARFYQIAEKCLRLSAKLYEKAGYLSRKNEALQSLEKMREERELALSLSDALRAPSILSSTTGISMPDSTESAAGLNEFESVNIQARLSAPEQFIPGEEVQIKLDLVNVGKKPGLLVRIEGIVPRRCKVVRVPSGYSLEDDSLNMRGKRLKPLTIESINIGFQIKDVISVSLIPKVVYVDELGNFGTCRVEMVKIRPVIEFKSKVAQVVLNYLIGAFLEDSVKRNLSAERSGWRSLPQIIRGAKVSKASLYGVGGRLGPALSELQNMGLVDSKVFHGERGRGGRILRVRICYEKEIIKRYVEEKTPKILS